MLGLRASELAVAILGRAAVYHFFSRDLSLSQNQRGAHLLDLHLSFATMSWGRRSRSDRPTTWHARTPRRSAFENFDESCWLDGVRENLRSALLHRSAPSSPHSAYVAHATEDADTADVPFVRAQKRRRILTLSSSSEGEEEEEEEEEPPVEEDVRAKSHFHRTAQALEELLSLGGVVDDEQQGPVHLDGFAEQVWRVDKPPNEVSSPAHGSASSLFSSFMNAKTGIVDVDALLRSRASPTKTPKRIIEVLDSNQNATESGSASSNQESEVDQDTERDNEDVLEEEVDDDDQDEAEEESDIDDALDGEEKTGDANYSSAQKALEVANVNKDEEQGTGNQAVDPEQEKGRAKGKARFGDVTDNTHSVDPPLSEVTHHDNLIYFSHDNRDTPPEAESDSVSLFHHLAHQDVFSISGIHASHSSDPFVSHHDKCVVHTHDLDTERHAPALADSLLSTDSAYENLSYSPEMPSMLASASSQLTNPVATRLLMDSHAPIVVLSDSDEDSGPMLSSIPVGHEPRQVDGEASLPDNVEEDWDDFVEEDELHAPSTQGEEEHAAFDENDSEENEPQEEHLDVQHFDGRAPETELNKSAYASVDYGHTNSPDGPVHTDMEIEPRTEATAIDQLSAENHVQPQPPLSKSSTHDSDHIPESVHLNTMDAASSSPNRDEETEQQNADDIRTMDRFNQAPARNRPNATDKIASVDVSSSNLSHADASMLKSSNVDVKGSTHECDEEPGRRTQQPLHTESLEASLNEPLKQAPDYSSYEQDTASDAHVRESTERHHMGNEDADGDSAQESKCTETSPKAESQKDSMHHANTAADKKKEEKDKDEGERWEENKIKEGTKTDDGRETESLTDSHQDLPESSHGASGPTESPDTQKASSASKAKTDVSPSHESTLEGWRAENPVASSHVQHEASQDVADSSMELPITQSKSPHCTRSHCPLQRLTLTQCTGTPTFLVRSCTLDPQVLEEEGAEQHDVLLDSLEMQPLNADALPEPVYHKLCRIVGPSMLEDVYVLPKSMAEQWMRSDEKEQETERKRSRRSSPVSPLRMRLRTPQERRRPRYYTPDA